VLAEAVNNEDTDNTEVDSDDSDDEPISSAEATSNKCKEQFADSPCHACFCCDRLFFRKAVTPWSEERLERVPEPLRALAEAWHAERPRDWVCGTCFNTMKKARYPRFCVNNGLDLPDVPGIIHGLNRLEERLVAPRTPFMFITRSIRARPYWQHKLKGKMHECEFPGTSVRWVITYMQVIALPLCGSVLNLF
jgi:hypothetical protein